MTAINNVNDALKPYADLFKGWQAKVLGDKPTADQLATMHQLGLRPGKQALANALALRDCGVSGAQIVMACGAPQLNRMRGLIAAGVVKRDMMTARNAQGHTVYKLNLTPKGEAAIKRANDTAAKAALKGDADQPAKPADKPKAAKPAKAAAAKKAASKPRKPKAAPTETPLVETPASDLPPVSQPELLAPETQAANQPAA